MPPLLGQTGLPRSDLNAAWYGRCVITRHQHVPTRMRPVVLQRGKDLRVSAVVNTQRRSILLLALVQRNQKPELAPQRLEPNHTPSVGTQTVCLATGLGQRKRRPWHLARTPFTPI